MRPTEDIKRLIENLQDTTSAKMDKRVLGDVLCALAESEETKSAVARPKIKKQTMSDRSRFWKVAAVIAIVIGTGALATTVGLKVRKLYFRGRKPDGTYMFATKPEVGEPMRGVKSHHVDNVEQKIKDLEEVELLRQQDTSRELLGVVETEVNGKLQPRSLKFKYILSDEREIKIMEGDPDTKDREGSLTSAQRDEVKSLLRADEYEELDIKEKEVRGRVFVFTRMRFVLSDGTEVIKSVGTPKKDQ